MMVMTNNYNQLLRQALVYAEEYLTLSAEREIYPDPASLNKLTHLDESLPTESTNEFEVLAAIHELACATTVMQNSGRYFGYVIGSLLPIAHAVGWLNDTYNQNSALYQMSPFGGAIENITQKWLNELFELDENCVTGFVSGSSTATLCALSIALYNIITNHDETKLQLIISEQAHATIFKALKILNFKENNIIKVPCDSYGRLKVEMLPPLDENSIVVIQAGNLNGGAVDDIAAVCHLAKQAQAWVHIDGAFGMWAGVSPKYKPLFKGLEQADSYALDAHKTLNAGYSCGLIICKHETLFKETMQTTASFINPAEPRNNMSYTPEMSKRNRALLVYASLKQLGKKGLVRMIEQLGVMAEYMAQELKKHGLTIINEVCFNQFMFYYQNDEQTKKLLNIINESGQCFFSGNIFNEHFIIRVSVCSYKTDKEAVAQTVKVVAASLAKLAK